MKYTVVLTEKGDGNVTQLDVGMEPSSDNLHFGTPWEWFGAFKNNPTWGKLFDELEQQRDSDKGNIDSLCIYWIPTYYGTLVKGIRLFNSICGRYPGRKSPYPR